MKTYELVSIAIVALVSCSVFFGAKKVVEAVKPEQEIVAFKTVTTPTSMAFQGVQSDCTYINKRRTIWTCLDGNSKAEALRQAGFTREF